MDDPGADRVFDSLQGLPLCVKYIKNFREQIQASVVYFTMEELLVTVRAELFFVQIIKRFPNTYRRLDGDKGFELQG